MSETPRLAVTAFVALGANLGDARATVLQAMQAVAALPDTAMLCRSSLYRSVPVDAAGPNFINAVVEISTRLSPQELLTELQDIEQSAGRERPYRNAPRTLDLDVLLYGDITLDSPTLTIPHPRMGDRAFVLLPLAEIAPQRVSAAQLRAVQNQSITRID